MQSGSSVLSQRTLSAPLAWDTLPLRVERTTGPLITPAASRRKAVLSVTLAYVVSSHTSVARPSISVVWLETAAMAGFSKNGRLAKGF